MSAQVQAHEAKFGSETRYRSILLAADASDHSNRGVCDAVTLGRLWQGRITAAHVYAAKMHDLRFRQMEGGLPERYRKEQELERQRDVHDELITRGLSVITESYLDEAEKACKQAGIDYARRSLEGKNYRELVREANSGDYDLLILGSQGLGSVQGDRLGTVCARTTRRIDIDTLVIKQPTRPIHAGPIVVAVDGSNRSFGGLVTALSLAGRWETPVHVISAYDPYYHYVAFNRIASVLSEEAGKVFRFKEQEKLHEDIIDAGLAKIYQSHLEVAESIAADCGVTISTSLLDGKPHEVIQKYATDVDASLLVIGKTGVHADDDLDIGGNTENLLRDVHCAVLLSLREHTPRLDVVAQSNTSWTVEAEARMQHVPSFAQGMARIAVLRYAQERGHTVVTDRIVVEATKNLCPAGHVAGEKPMTTEQGRTEPEQVSFAVDWAAEASAIAAGVTDEALRKNLCSRAEKKARQEGAKQVQAVHIKAFLDPASPQPGAGRCPMGFGQAATEKDETKTLPWSERAKERLQRVPDGFMRRLTKQRVEVFARKQGVERVTTEVMVAKFSDWAAGAAKQQRRMHWDARSLARIQRIPDFVRGMVIKEVERCAEALGREQVDSETFRQASAAWANQGTFHSDHKPEQYSQ